MNKSIKAVVSGKVQGVWFRASTKEAAQNLNIKGYAKNLSNGDVEVMATGSDNDLLHLITFLSQGPELAVVDNINWQYIEFQQFNQFETR
ncbi:acylphosphatase [Pseudoalteromonas denitrificans]|uniref:Acylphosphatase n=1 Tax=Pseudoalteromonas denitrificans DSM 6059 TaxID=1123010 RepID=A0A1I1KZV6_9GAMM|nr:acylphosphatase [Pseudoalteromonas denitrificans]SFC66329.1 acylphosphatase [Pseudoalteromonas denitrificans DSM 6059]